MKQLAHLQKKEKTRFIRKSSPSSGPSYQGMETSEIKTTTDELTELAKLTTLESAKTGNSTILNQTKTPDSAQRKAREAKHVTQDEKIANEALAELGLSPDTSEDLKQSRSNEKTTLAGLPPEEITFRKKVKNLLAAISGKKAPSTPNYLKDLKSAMQERGGFNIDNTQYT